MATDGEEQSLSELEREAEHTRADLVHTVDELHNRVSPQAIKQEMKAYALGASQDFIQNLERRARENPLQTVAVAAGLAYPAWRFVANIPAPILLIGAGLALSQLGTRAREHMRQDQGDEQFTDRVKRTVRDASSQLGETLDSVKERAAAATGEATGRVSELSERAGTAIKEATTSARDTATETLAGVRETLSGTYKAGVETAGRTGAQISDTFRESKHTLTETMENHPFVVGGIGLLVGALVASALPVSQAENRLLGDTSEDLKKRARDIASEGASIATAAAQTVYQEAVSSVQEQGVSAEGVREVVRDVSNQVKDVVRQASDTLGKEDNPSSTTRSRT